jgi:hypothetical protein
MISEYNAYIINTKQNVYKAIIQRRSFIINNIDRKIYDRGVNINDFYSVEDCFRPEAEHFLNNIKFTESEIFYINLLSHKLIKYTNIAVEKDHLKNNYCLCITLEDIRFNFIDDKIDKAGSIEVYLKTRKLAKKVKGF